MKRSRASAGHNNRAGKQSAVWNVDEDKVSISVEPESDVVNSNPSTHFNKSSEHFTEKYSIDPAKILDAVYYFLTYGPNFGDNANIMVFTNSNATNVFPSSFIKFPISYTDTTGKDDNTFTWRSRIYYMRHRRVQARLILLITILFLHTD
jgi:hypothetical protein